jgi:hypothetical protein
MSRNHLGWFSGCLLLALSARADTLTFRNNAELNGSVRFADDSFTVTARYAAGTKTTTFQRAEVRMLEINGRDFNPGEPPREVSVFKERAAATTDAAHPENRRGMERSPRPGSRPAEQSARAERSMFGSGDLNPSTTDVIWLRSKIKVEGRLVRIDDGELTVQSLRSTKKLKLIDVVTVLMAPQ